MVKLWITNGGMMERVNLKNLSTYLSVGGMMVIIKY